MFSYFVYCYLRLDMIYLYHQERKGGNTDEQENRQADKSGSSTHSTCLRNWNSHSSHKNDNREHPIGSGEGNLPPT